MHYDHAGRRYLDAYNNVPHVGHNHPRAGRHRQMLLVTNTRYCDNLPAFMGNLIATLPDRSASAIS